MSKQKHAQPASRPQASWLSSLSPTAQDLLCVALLFVVILVLFRGIVFDRMAFSSQGDTAAALSYQHVGMMIQEKEGADAIWMPYFFSGMPTFGNVAFIPHDVSYIQWVLVRVLNLLFLNGPWTWMVVFYFLNGVSMFLLMRVWKFSRSASLIAAVTVMLSPYAIGLAGEGHGSKLMALSYLPLVFLLTHELFERRNFLTFGLLAAAIGTLMLTNHMQIVYYVFITIGFYLIYHVILDLREQRVRALAKVLLFAGALAIGMCISAYVYLSVYEYAQYSIRGGGTTGASGGLTYDYATNFSLNPWELLTLFIPGFFGFQSPFYWGTKPFSSSTVYIGILPLLLATLAVVYNRSRTVIFFIVTVAIVLLMSFGKHFPIVYNLLFDYLPFFNKFRAPEMILHLLPFLVGFLAAYGYTFVTEIFERLKTADTARLTRTLLTIGGVLVALLVIGLMFRPSVYDSMATFMFEKADQAQELRAQYGQRADQALAKFKELRFDIFWKDFVKFVIIAAASLGAIVAFLSKRIQKGTLSALLLGILIVDLVIIDVKFITPTPESEIDKNFRPDASVAYLLRQPGNFRVLPLGQLFGDNTYAYHGVQSVGGYSPAKLKIYQTLIDSCLYHGADPSFPLNMAVVNMLNTRYVLAAGRLPEDRFRLVNSDPSRRILTYENPGALPRSFFVREAVVAANDHDVFGILNSPGFDPAKTAVLFSQPPQFSPPVDTPRCEVTSYASRRITVTTTSASPGLLVLSEVYYPAGWKAFIDGAETGIYRTDYVLRSVFVPAGTHEVVFSFDPEVYALGYTLTRFAWGASVLCIIVGLWSLPSVKRLVKRRSAPPPAPAG